MVGALLQTLPELQQQLGQPGRVVEVSREPVDDAGVVLPEGAWSSGTAATGRARSIDTGVVPCPHCRRGTRRGHQARPCTPMRSFYGTSS